jgi:predicted solute-binding protein
MALRVARIPYLNSVPFYQRVPERLELLDLPPRQLGQAAREGAVDAGILSLCDILRTPGLESLGGLGVAVDGPAHSVLLFTRERPERIDGGTVGVTSETSTSFPLLRLLLERRYDAGNVHFERRFDPATQAGQLLIGDSALRAAAIGGLMPGRSEYGAEALELDASDRQPWRWALDLGAVWCDWQRQPFVFAEWVVREEVPTPACDELERALEESLAWSEQHADELAARNEGAMGLSAKGVAEYLAGFTYRLGARERRAIDTFREMIESTTWWSAGELSTTGQER